MAFLWRGRLYVVREVLGHWHERRDWWSTAAARALHGEDWPSERPPAPEGPSFAVWSGQETGSSGELPGGVPGRVPGQTREHPGGRKRREPVERLDHREHPQNPEQREQQRENEPGALPRRSRHRLGDEGTRRGGASASVTCQEPAVTRSETGARGYETSECEVWRVEASTGRAFGNGVYDLSRTPSADRSSGPASDSWRLLQVAD
ncbi:hypothetical protein JCM9957A_10090 [Kineosporia succinea]|uniref:DUF6504 domain-containing protein n=2 Tax=Kineosporia succinea TaxID=84632 RepID=A0ABT9P7A2_9ACTN|nr:hypothetical protein [Kineosporia succinea]